MSPHTLWLIAVFFISFFVYLSFSVVQLDAVVALTQPIERRKGKYEIPPLSTLLGDSERLLSVLSFCRLLFIVPALLLAYRWSAQGNGLTVLVSTLCMVLLLYLLPQWLMRSSPLPAFRATVRWIVYLLYPLFWLTTKKTPVAPPLPEPANHAVINGEPAEEESEEFKGDILKAVSVIGETTVREVMTPRVDIIGIPSSANLGELHQLFKEHKFSRLPVYKEKIDNIIGIVSVMDLVGSMPVNNSDTPVTNIMRPAVFVPETKKVFTLLRELRESHAQMAIVIDEYGGTSGLVTLEDLLEEIVGEIEDEYDEAPFESHREKDGSYIVSGKFPIEQLEEIFNVKIPAEDFETISGLVFSVVGRIPMVGEIIKFENLNLEILEADKRRIHRLRIRAIEPKNDKREVVQ